MPSIDRRIAHLPRWLRLGLGVLPGLLIALLAVRETLAALLPRLAAQGIEIGTGISDLAQRLVGMEQTVRVKGERTREVVRETAESTGLRLAAIALKQHAEADRLIQNPKREPLAEAFRLLALEGDNWYNAGEFDRAIGPYAA